VAKPRKNDKYLRDEAAGALGEIGPAAAPAVPALITALRVRYWALRRSAAWALGRIGSPEATGALEAPLAIGEIRMRNQGGGEAPYRQHQPDRTGEQPSRIANPPPNSTTTASIQPSFTIGR